MDLFSAFFFWIAHTVVPQGALVETPDGHLRLYVRYDLETVEVQRTPDGFVILPPPSASDEGSLRVTIDPAGRIVFDAEGEPEIMDLAGWFDTNPIPRTLEEFVQWQCSTPISKESCGIFVDEAAGRLSTWDGFDRLDLAWKRGGFDPQPQCFNVLTSLGQAGIEAASFSPLGGFEEGLTTDGTLQSEHRITDGAGVRGWRLELSQGQQVVYSANTSSWMTELLMLGPDGCALDELRTGPFMAEVEARERGTHVLLLLSEFSDSGPSPVSIEVAGSAEAHTRGSELSSELWDDDIDWDSLRDLPVGLVAQGRVLPVGATRESRLLGAASAFSTPGRHPLEAWSVALEPGQTITVDLRSEDFDAYLYLAGGSILSPIQNDDGGEGLNSQIVYTSLNGGTYLVVASAFGENSQGAYTLEAREGDWGYEDDASWADEDWMWDEGDGWVERTLPGSLSAQGRVLRLDTQVEGRLLGEGSPFFTESGDHPLEAWILTLAPGQTVTLDLRSEDFDAYLYLAEGGLSSPIQNDDGGEGLNSQIVYTSPGGGTYLVVASSYGMSSGPYTLEAREGDFAYEDNWSWDDEDQMDWQDWEWDEGEGWTERVLPADLSSEGRTIDLNTEVEGRLSGDTASRTEGGYPIEAWSLTLRPGQTVILDLRSEDFDTYLYLTGGALTSPIEDDDGGDGLNSQILYTSQSGGTYLVVVSSFGTGSGRYILGARGGGLER